MPNAILSVQNQTYKDLEIIVVDDGSKDNTKAVVASIQDVRLRYIHHEKNQGLAATRNTGIAAAGGRYIAFLDDDDEWRHNKIEKQLQVIERHDAVLCASASTKTGKKTQVYRKSVVDHSVLRKGNIFDPSSLMAKAAVFQDLLFDVELPRSQGEDWDMFIRIASKYRIGYIDEPLVIYGEGTHHRITNERVNMPIPELEKRMEVLRKHREFFGPRWFNYHTAAMLLSYIARRDHKFRQVSYAIKRCGWAPVLQVLSKKVTRQLPGW